MRMEDYRYLMFRRMVVFMDEWLSYLLLLYLYYHLREKNKMLLGIIITMMMAFNLTGYYYLELLETRYRLYESPPQGCYLF